MQPNPGAKLGVLSRIWVVNAKLKHQIPPHSFHISLQAPKHQRGFPLLLQCFPSGGVHISSMFLEQSHFWQGWAAGSWGTRHSSPKSFKEHDQRGICKACWTHSWLPLSFKTLPWAEGPLCKTHGVKVLTWVAEEQHLYFPRAISRIWESSLDLHLSFLVRMAGCGPWKRCWK